MRFWGCVASLGYLVLCYAAVFAIYLGCVIPDVSFTNRLCQTVCSPENQIYLLAAKQVY